MKNSLSKLQIFEKNSENQKNSLKNLQNSRKIAALQNRNLTGPIILITKGLKETYKLI